MSASDVSSVVRLANGLTVVMAESRAAPVVALQAWVRVGGADERSSEAGLAHLHEHMLFKGTARRATGEIAREVESRGGEINAWTSHDETVYHLVLASPFVAEGLDLLSDALRFSAFDAQGLGRETQVVVEEIKRSEDSPGRRLSRELFKTAYRDHPYRLPVIGTPESVLGFTRPQILDFYRRHYRPGNVVLVVVGDCERASALAEVERVFGDWEGAAPAALVRAREPGQSAARVRIVRGGFRETRLALAFHIPDLAHPDVAALDLLGIVLGQGESCILAERLKRDQRLFQEVYAYAYTPKDPGLWVAGGTPTRGQEEAALAALVTALGAVRDAPLSEADLAKAKHLVDAEQVYQRETVQGWARKLGYYQTTAGSLEAEGEYRARVQATTLDDLRAVAQRYLEGAHCSLVVLEAQDSARPLDEASWGERLSRELGSRPAGRVGTTTLVPRSIARAPRPGAARSEPLASFALSGGGTLLVKHEGDVPIVALRAAFLGGVRGESEADNGITALLSRTLTRGAAGKTADQIAQTIDGLAGSLHAVAGRNSFGVRGEFLARDFARGLGLLADCLLSPDFPAPEVERERAQLLQDIHAREDNPAGLAFELFQKTLFTVSSQRLPLGGETRSVESLDGSVLRAHLAQRYPLRGLTLAVVGDVEVEGVRQAVESALGSAASRGEASVPGGQQEPRPTSPRAARRKLDKAQSHLVLGYLGVAFADRARYALDVLSGVLSGQGGRLFLELRDRKSLAYSVSSLSVEGIDPGYFAVYIGTSPDKVPAALAGIRAELSRVREERISEAELDRARRHLIGVHAIGLQRRAAVAGALALDQTYGLGPESYRRYADAIQAVSAEQIRGVAQAVLDPGGEVVAEVGP